MAERKEITPITPDRWMANLIDAASAIADREHQERRWLAPDAYAWEFDGELINSLYDDCVFEEFLSRYADTFNEEQRCAGLDLKHEGDEYCDGTPPWRESAEVLADPRWEAVRLKARNFIDAFKDKWPPGGMDGTLPVPYGDETRPPRRPVLGC